jgi:predicted HTH transcriptional regulator
MHPKREEKFMKRKETQNVEFKQSWRDEFLKEICGFANAQGDRVNDRVSDRVNDRVNFADEILLLVEKNPGLRSKDLAVLAGKSIPTLSRFLKSLKDNGKIEFRGAPKNGGYFVK